MIARLEHFAATHRWIWAALGVLLLWAALVMVTERFSLHSLTGVATSAAFLLIVALGQMLVVTTGRGNIDLSIPSVVTLSAYVTVIVSGGQDAALPLTLLCLVGIGCVTGLVNAFLVVVLRIPAIIATLASGYALATATLIANRQVKGMATADTLAALATGRLGGIPVIVLIGVAAAALTAFVLTRTAYGRQLSAVGQSLPAAWLSGVRVGTTVTIAFVASALLASVAGMLLSAYAGGAFLEMGSPYLLQSVGAVVLGGSLIAGGASTTVGTIFGALLLVLVITTMQIAGMPPGTQDIVQGLVIIAVMAFAGEARGRATPKEFRSGAGRNAP